MGKPVILVTGATGRIGGVVAEQLCNRNFPVRALVHRVDRRSDRLRALNAEVVAADLFDPLQMERALQGVQRAFWLGPVHPYMLQAAVVFAGAARDARLEALVTLSQWLSSPSHPSLLTRQTWLSERLFEQSLPATMHVTVNPGWFADTYLYLIGTAAQLGVFPMPLGKSRNAPPSNEDIARVAVGALIDPERHHGRTYRPTGPRLLDATEMAQAMGEALGRKVRHVEVPWFLFNRAVRVTGRALGVDPYLHSQLLHYVRENLHGTFAVGAPTTHVRDVAGVEPEEFVVAARRAAQRPEARRTLGNLTRALVNFLRIGLTPGLDLEGFERLQQHPAPAVPAYAAHSETWIREHGAERESAPAVA